jgi:hypothetical protein
MDTQLTNCAGFDGEEVDSGAERLEKEDDAVPVRFDAPMIGINHRPDGESQLQQAEDLRQV